MEIFYIDMKQMATISVDKTLFEDLISFKIRRLTEDIQNILIKWKYSSANDFIDDVRSGKIREAEMDAIEIRQILHDQQELRKLLEKKG